jgi:hypothetical protein
MLRFENVSFATIYMEIWNPLLWSHVVCKHGWMHTQKLKYWSSCNTKRRLKLHAHGYGMNKATVFASCRHMRYDRMSRKRKVLFRKHARLLKRTTKMDEADATFLHAVNINAASWGEAARTESSPRIIWRHGPD